jgi:hypothetical protein
MDGYPQYQRTRGEEEHLYPQQRVKDPFRYSIDLAVMKSLTPID